MGLRDLTVRKFRTEDAKAVAAIINSSLQSSGGSAEITLKHVLTLSNNRKMYVALNDHTIVGTASIDYDTIQVIYVREEYQNQSVEEALIKLLEEIASNNGILHVKLEADKSEQGLYKRLGYSTTEETTESELGEFAIMEKFLT